MASGEEYVPDPDLPEQNKATAMKVAELTGKKILHVGVCKTSPFYDLDTFLASLPDGKLLLYPVATTEQSILQLNQKIGADNIIEINERQARKFSANLINIPETTTLVMTFCDADLQKILEQNGYVVISPRTVGLGDEATWQVANGGVRCLTSESFYKNTAAIAHSRGGREGRC